MTQVSRPMLIALVGVVAFAAVWFTVLRPKTTTTTPDDAVVTPVAQNQPTTAAPAATPSSGGGTSLTDRPAQAQSAVDAANSQIAGDKAQADAVANGAATPAASPSSAATATPAGSSSASSSASSSTSSAPATPGATSETSVTAPGAAPGERTVLRKLEDGKVVVMLFWNASSADDRAAKRAVAEATRGDDGVYVRVVKADKVGSYEAITGDLAISQTPTTVIVGPERKAVTISGLIDPLEIKQAVARMTPAKG